MRTVSLWACASIPEATTNLSVPSRQKRRCSICSKIRTSSTVRMRGLAIPIPACSMTLAEESLWSHNPSRSWAMSSSRRYSMTTTIVFLRMAGRHLWRPWRHLIRTRGRTGIFTTDTSINRFLWIRSSTLACSRPNDTRTERQGMWNRKGHWNRGSSSPTPERWPSIRRAFGADRSSGPRTFSGTWIRKHSKKDRMMWPDSSRAIRRDPTVLTRSASKKKPDTMDSMRWPPTYSIWRRQRSWTSSQGDTRSRTVSRSSKHILDPDRYITDWSSE